MKLSSFFYKPNELILEWSTSSQSTWIACNMGKKCIYIKYNFYILHGYIHSESEDIEKLDISPTERQS